MHDRSFKIKLGEDPRKDLGVNRLTRSPALGDLFNGGDTKGPKGKTSTDDSSSEDEHETAGADRR